MTSKVIKTEQLDDKANKSFERWRAMQPYAGATEREHKAFLAGFSAAINGPLPTKDELMKRLVAGMNEAAGQAVPTDIAQGPVDQNLCGEPQQVAIRITEQGCVRVNTAYLHKAGNGIAAVYIDLASKRAVFSCTNSGNDEPPSVTLAADENTLNLDKSKPRESVTTFDFPEYHGWSVFAANGPNRYTLAVCLVAS